MRRSLSEISMSSNVIEDSPGPEGVPHHSIGVGLSPSYGFRSRSRERYSLSPPPSSSVPYVLLPERPPSALGATSIDQYHYDSSLINTSPTYQSYNNSAYGQNQRQHHQSHPNHPNHQSHQSHQHQRRLSPLPYHQLQQHQPHQQYSSQYQPYQQSQYQPYHRVGSPTVAHPGYSGSVSSPGTLGAAGQQLPSAAPPALGKRTAKNQTRAGHIQLPPISSIFSK